MMRYSLERLFGLDTYNQVWMTNVIKCDPGAIKPQEKHAKACCDTWFLNELSLLDTYIPEVPILVAGTLALKGLKYLFKELNHTMPSLNDCRKRVFHLGQHPLVCTFNPAPIAKSEFRIETEVELDEANSYRVDKVEVLDPPIIGSPVWDFWNDLEYLRIFL
jgi:hypothetical protein